MVALHAPAYSGLDVAGGSKADSVTPRSRSGKEIVARGYLPGSSCPTRVEQKTAGASTDTSTRLPMY